MMENKQLCQSCSMPLDNSAMAGTEKDGSKSTEYCKYCYQDGKFISPDMSLEDMKTIVTTQMQKMSIAPETISLALNTLPHLKRWNGGASKA